MSGPKSSESVGLFFIANRHAFLGSSEFSARQYAGYTFTERPRLGHPLQIPKPPCTLLFANRTGRGFDNPHRILHPAGGFDLLAAFCFSAFSRHRNSLPLTIAWFSIWGPLSGGLDVCTDGGGFLARFTEREPGQAAGRFLRKAPETAPAEAD